jgi:hypothetical protein
LEGRSRRLRLVHCLSAASSLFRPIWALIHLCLWIFTVRSLGQLGLMYSSALPNAPFCAVALHAMYYNFLRIHQTLRVTPAMAAGVTDRVWEMGDLVEMLEAFEARRDVA